MKHYLSFRLHGHETKATRTTSIAIIGHESIAHIAVLGEQFAEIIILHTPAQVANEQTITLRSDHIRADIK